MFDAPASSLINTSKEARICFLCRNTGAPQIEWVIICGNSRCMSTDKVFRSLKQDQHHIGDSRLKKLHADMITTVHLLQSYYMPRINGKVKPVCRTPSSMKPISNGCHHIPVRSDRVTVMSLHTNQVLSASRALS